MMVDYRGGRILNAPKPPPLRQGKKRKFIFKCHKWGLLLTILEAWKSKLKVSAFDLAVSIQTP